MKRILITGGAGFIGSHLCRHLHAEGHFIVCLDNLQTGNLQNISHMLDEPRFQFIKHDVIDPIDIEVDEIYNFACPASPPLYQMDPVHTLRTNVWGIWNLLELAKKHNAKILQASTSEVYGDPLEHPQTEKYWGHVNPIGIRSCYDEGKRTAETLLSDYRRMYNTRTKIVRIFNTYGPYMNPGDGRVVSNFIVQVLKGEPITIYGSGEQTRSFCYVEDLVRGIVGFMETKDDVAGPINLGNPEEFTVKELAEKVIAMCGKGSQLIFLPLPADDPTQRKPDISLAEAVLSWRPVVKLTEGLEKTVSYFSSVLGK